MNMLTELQDNALDHAKNALDTASPAIESALNNLSGSVNELYVQAASKAAAMSATQGYEKALKSAVVELAKKGVSAYTTSNGARVPVDVGIRRALNDAARDHRLSQTLDIAEKLGVNLVEVSCTTNPRPSHQAWQGKVYQLEGSDKYPNYYEACHVGDPVDGIGGYNCGHNTALYYEGQPRVFKDPLEGTGYTPEQARALTTRQRELERGIRSDKRIIEALKAADLDHAEYSRALNAKRAKLRALIAENPAILRRQRYREGIYQTAVRRVGKVEPVTLFEKTEVENPRRLAQKPKSSRKTANSISGVKQGSPMTFAKADGMNPNPNYSTGKKEYRINCQTCVVAYEARRRGFDIMATGNKNGSVNGRVSRNQGLAYLDPTKADSARKNITVHNVAWEMSGIGTATDYEREHVVFAKVGTVGSDRKLYQWLEDNVQQGRRYSYRMCWSGADGAHIVSIERDGDGVLMLYDPQNGKVLKGADIMASHYVASVMKRTKKQAWMPYLMRVDDMEFNSEIVDEILEASSGD